MAIRRDILTEWPDHGRGMLTSSTRAASVSVVVCTVVLGESISTFWKVYILLVH